MFTFTSVILTDCTERDFFLAEKSKFRERSAPIMIAAQADDAAVPDSALDATGAPLQAAYTVIILQVLSGSRRSAGSGAFAHRERERQNLPCNSLDMWHASTPAVECMSLPY